MPSEGPSDWAKERARLAFPFQGWPRKYDEEFINIATALDAARREGAREAEAALDAVKAAAKAEACDSILYMLHNLADAELPGTPGGTVDAIIREVKVLRAAAIERPAPSGGTKEGG